MYLLACMGATEEEEYMSSGGGERSPRGPVLVLAVCLLPVFVVIAPGGGRLGRLGRPPPDSADLHLTEGCSMHHNTPQVLWCMTW